MVEDRGPHGAETHYVRRAGMNGWIRLGEAEWRLLQAVRRRPDSVQATLAHEVSDWSSGDVALARERFARLGLLEDDAQLHAGGMESIRPVAWAVTGSLVPAIIVFQVVSMMRIATWQSWFVARPPAWLAIALVVFLAAVHEAGHILIALAAGYPAGAFRVAVGWLGWIPVPTVRLEQFWAMSRAGRTAVVLGGSYMQLLLAAAAGCLTLVWVCIGHSPPAVLLWLQTASILLAAVNLLPAYPLDGYWLLAVRLDRPRLREESRLVRAVSEGAAVVLTGLFLLWLAGTFVLPR